MCATGVQRRKRNRKETLLSRRRRHRFNATSPGNNSLDIKGGRLGRFNTVLLRVIRRAQNYEIAVGVIEVEVNRRDGTYYKKDKWHNRLGNDDDKKDCSCKLAGLWSPENDVRAVKRTQGKSEADAAPGGKCNPSLLKCNTKRLPSICVAHLV